VRAALAAGTKVLVVGRADRLALLGDHLAGSPGVDTDAVDMVLDEDWYVHPARMLSACVDYAREATGETLFVGEQPWRAWTAREAREWVRAESLCNRVLAATRGTGLCLYDRRRTPPDIATAMDRTHPYRWTGDGALPNPGYVPPERLRLEGDDKPFDDPPAHARSVDFTLSGLKRLRDFVTARALRAGLDADLTTSLVLCVAEIAANTVEHGAGHGRAWVWRHGTELVCEIADPGGGFAEPNPGYLLPPDGAPRGYGLWIARQLRDLMEIRTGDGVCRIRLHMSIGPR
jgi:anti-sigma regulatory factor (Ser/Thr protein kinase)